MHPQIRNTSTATSAASAIRQYSARGLSSAMRDKSEDDDGSADEDDGVENREEPTKWLKPRVAVRHEMATATDDEHSHHRGKDGERSGPEDPAPVIRPGFRHWRIGDTRRTGRSIASTPPA